MTPHRYLDGDPDPVDDRCPGCGYQHWCWCEYDAEGERLHLTAQDLADERSATDTAYRAWAAPVVRLVLRRAA